MRTLVITGFLTISTFRHVTATCLSRIVSKTLILLILSFLRPTVCMVLDEGVTFTQNEG